MMCVALNLARFGNTYGKSLLSTPIHSAIGAKTLSQGYCGMSRPLPTSCSLPSSRDVGYLLYNLPPLMLPPRTKWLPAHAWSVPTPFDVSVRPKSEADIKVTLSKMFCVFSSPTKLSKAPLISANFAFKTSPLSLCVSKPPSSTKKISRATFRGPRLLINRETWCSWAPSVVAGKPSMAVNSSVSKREARNSLESMDSFSCLAYSSQ
mmetsp:Transcript_139324/g.445489  ORF Transcript_139324/g.445489 Transcript_139324/m.445489 type:complete len:207 (-) Transcript_139324:5241-5861(-)